MTLKRSFLGSMVQNLKRRRAVIVLVFMLLFFLYPVNFLLVLRTAAQGHFSNPNEQIESCMAAAGNVIYFNQYVFWIFGVIGLVIGIQAFGFLHKKNKVDLYNSVPVSYNRRFLVILANSIIIVAVPLIICYFLSLPLFGAYHILNSTTAGTLFVTMMTGFLFSMGVFSTASLAVCLTGRSFISALGSVILLVYEMGLYGLLNIYMERSFETYVSTYSESILMQPKFSLIYYVSEILGASNNKMYTGNKFDIFSLVSSGGNTVGFCIWMMLLVTIVTLLLAYICFKKRPGEAAGRSMAFDKTKRIIKYLIVIPAALYGAELFNAMWEDDFFTFIIGLVITVMMGNMMIEVIYEGDIRSALKHLIDIPLTMGIVVVWLGIFSNDVLGFDSYIPKQDSLKAIAFNGAYDYDFAGYYIEKQGQYYDTVNPTAFWMEHPYDDEKSKEVILNAITKRKSESSDYEIIVGYYLKNGQKKYRKYWISADSKKEIEDVVRETESYKAVVFKGIYELRGDIKSAVICDESGNRMEVPEEDIDEILDAYTKDIEGMSVKDIAEKVPAGSIRLALPVYDGYAEMLNYPFCRDFANTISCLEKKGLYYSDYLKNRSIESVSVYNFRVDENGALMHDDRYPEGEDYKMYCVDSFINVYDSSAPIYNRKWSISEDKSDVIRRIAETGKSHYLTGNIVYNGLESERFNGADSCYAVQIHWKSVSGEYNTDTFYFEEDSIKDIEEIIKLYGKEE